MYFIMKEKISKQSYLTLKEFLYIIDSLELKNGNFLSKGGTYAR